MMKFYEDFFIVLLAPATSAEAVVCSCIFFLLNCHYNNKRRFFYVLSPCSLWQTWQKRRLMMADGGWFSGFVGEKKKLNQRQTSNKSDYAGNIIDALCYLHRLNAFCIKGLEIFPWICVWKLKKFSCSSFKLFLYLSRTRYEKINRKVFVETEQFSTFL